MGKVIRNAAELPDWFSAAKYNECVRLDVRGWYEQLNIRMLCHEMAEYPDQFIESDWKKSFGVTPLEFLSAVRHEPVFSFQDTIFESVVNDFIGFEDSPWEHQLAYPPGIYAVTHYDIIKMILEWDAGCQQQFVDFLNYKRTTQSSTSAKTLRRPNFPRLFHPVSTRSEQPITILAGFPDKVLQESFKLFLTKERQESDYFLAANDKRANSLIEWCNCGLLQFLDLAIWAMLNNVTITNKAFAHGIFPRNIEKGEENIRKTTRKHASIILDPAGYQGMQLSTLLAYARIEDLKEVDTFE